MSECVTLRTVVAGEPISGPVAVSTRRLSFWGGFDPLTGQIVEPRNSLRGRDVTGHVLIFPSTKGSSGTSNMLMLARRTGHLPAAFINFELDAMAVLAAVVVGIPLLLADTPAAVDRLRELVLGSWVTILPSEGRVELL